MSVRATRIACVAALGACTPDPLVVAPVIESPTDDADAAAFGAIDELVISIATEGDERDLVTKRFAKGEVLEVPDVPFGSNLVMHLTGVRGAQNVAYGRTCAFAVAPGVAPAEPHVFFSRSQKFAKTALVPQPRTNGEAISYLGSVILLGGGATNIEQFDPLTGERSLFGPVSPRTGAVGALLGVSPARIALVGGLDDSMTPSRLVEVFDPREGVDTIDDARMGRVGMTATSLADGRVIAVGGNAPSAAPVGTITQLTPDGSSAAIRDVATLLYPRTEHTATRLGDDLGAPVLIAGGRDSADAPVPIAELFKPLSGTLANPATFAPVMKHPRSHHHAARMPDGSVLFIGGLDAAGAPVRQLERFTIDEGFVDVVDSSARVVELDPEFGIVDMTVTELPDGRLLIAGGRTAPGGPATSIAYVLRLDPGTGTLDVLRTDPMAVARANHQAAVLCDGTVFVSGGATDSPAERYNPPPAGRR